MPSVIELIASAEEQARGIRDEAAAKAKEQVTNANAQVRTKLAVAKDAAQQGLVARRKTAQDAANRLTSEILAARAKNTDATYRAAETNLSSAVAYILRKAGMA